MGALIPESGNALPPGRIQNTCEAQRYVLAGIRGRLRMPGETVRVSRPWLLSTGLSRALASVFATAAFGIVSTDKECFEVIVERRGVKKALVVRFGGIPLKRQRTAVMADREPLKPNHISTTESVKRLLADCCEICGSTSRIEVHLIR